MEMLGNKYTIWSLLICLIVLYGCEVDTRPNPNKSKMSGNKALTVEDTKGDQYWSEMADATAFNDIQINSIRMIILENERKKKNLPLSNGVPDKTQIQELNKDKITQLVHLLGDYKEYRKVKDFEKNQILKRKQDRLDRQERKKKKLRKDSLKALEEPKEIN